MDKLEKTLSHIQMAIASLPDRPSTEQARRLLRSAFGEIADLGIRDKKKRPVTAPSGLTKTSEIKLIPMMTSREIGLAIKKLDKMIEDEQKSLEDLQKKSGADQKDGENGTGLQTIFD